SLALEKRDETVFDALAERGPLMVAVDRTAPGWADTAAWLQRSVAASDVQRDEGFAFFLVRGHPRGAPGCTEHTLPIVAARDLTGPLDIRPFTDGDAATSWTAGESQHAGDLLTLDLGRIVSPCGVRMALGKRPERYPNALSMATSEDANSWQVQFNQKLGGETIRAALANPLNVTLDLPLSGEPARYVRLRIEADQPKASWTVTEVAVVGREAGR
ncbi:MAG TPA: discoidin domain-containing protein, partial [Vicinamibacterales bacterium]